MANDARNATFQDLERDLAQKLGLSFHDLQFKAAHQLKEIPESRLINAFYKGKASKR